MTRRERAIFAPLVVATILFGVYPAPILDTIGPSVEALVSNYQVAVAEADIATQVAHSE
jgi:NADH-quinone oxidoreductase subunit M